MQTSFGKELKEGSMQIAEIAGRNVSSLSTDERNRVKKKLTDAVSEQRIVKSKDSISVSGKLEADMVQMNQLQKDYQQNSSSLNSMMNTQKWMEEIQKKGMQGVDWKQTNGELSSLMNEIRMNGERITSLFDVSVKDEKSFSALNDRLKKEIGSIQNKIVENRKQIGEYLVKRENIEGIYNYSADKAVEKIAMSINRNNIQSIFSQIDNANKLL